MSEQTLPDLSAVRGVVLDVDGVLTDGKIIYSDAGYEIKQFHVQDGASIKLLIDQAVPVAIITGRRSPIIARRARELGISYVAEGASNKPEALQQLIKDGFPDGDLIAVGDDLQDLALFNTPAISAAVTVPNAHPTVIERADWVTDRRGGEGVVVEIAQALLLAQNKWPY